MVQIITNSNGGGGGGAGAYTYKGTVNTYEDLPSTGLKIGDVYNVINEHTTDPKFPAGANVAWTGTEWDVLGGTIDLSSYQKKLVEGTGIDIDQTTNEISVDTTVIATKQDLTTKQDVISDLDTIRSNASAGKSAKDTIDTYGNIVTHNVSEFATAAQGAKADTALQPNDNVSELVNDAGYLVSSDLKQSDWGQTDSSKIDYIKNKPTIGNATLTIQKNGTTVNSITMNSTSNVTANISVPTDTSDLTNGAGFITNSALSGYQTTANLVTNLSNPDDTHYPSAKAVSDAITSSGGGDMLKSVYDPNNVAANAFDYDNFINTPNLSAVATSGSYSDLSNTPSLAAVATSGSYNDLSNKPTIPTVNNATLTIQKNGTTVKTFTANASSNVTANITVPTKTSDITNDSGFITNAVNNLTNYYLKTELYNKSEVDTLLSNFGGFEVVATLPTTDIKSNVIYLKGPIGTGADKYEEWIYYSNTWTKIGETSVDLSPYLNLNTQTSDVITEGFTKLFLTTGERTKLGNTSGTNSGDETTASIKTKLGAATSNADGYLKKEDFATFNGKQDALSTQTAYTNKGSATKVPQISTNTLGQVTGITEVDIQAGETYNAGKGIEIGDDYSAMQGPAPDGFHVPLTTERKAVKDIRTALGGGSSDGTNFGIALKLPFAGYRSLSSAGVSSQGSHGFYWSSSRINPSFAYILDFGSTSLNPQSAYDRADGYSVRCFKNVPTIPTSTWTKLYGTSIESGGIFWNSSKGLISLSYNGQTWVTIADKNLGATQVWNSGNALSQANCGNYYQWGNNYGFPFTGSVTTSSTRVDASTYGPGNYYSSSTFITRISSPYRWDSTDNGNLRGGVTGVISNAISNTISTITVTLTSAGWSSKSQTVSATGVTASNTVIVSPAPSDIADYADCGVYCSAQGSGTLTFGCDTAPSGDIVVNVLIMS